jgi:hypothetical protein
VADKDPMEAIEYELEEGRAYALGQAGKRVETALAALAERRGDRELLLDQAADAVWGYLILRETAGFYDHARALAIYEVPSAVMARVGIVRRR